MVLSLNNLLFMKVQLSQGHNKMPHNTQEVHNHSGGGAGAGRPQLPAGLLCAERESTVRVQNIAPCHYRE